MYSPPFNQNLDMNKTILNNVFSTKYVIELICKMCYQVMWQLCAHLWYLNKYSILLSDINSMEVKTINCNYYCSAFGVGVGCQCMFAFICTCMGSNDETRLLWCTSCEIMLNVYKLSFIQNVNVQQFTWS